MEPQFHLGDDLNALERALKELAPTPARLDVAQTMFRAGQASVRRPRGWQRLWPATSALLAVVSITLGTLLAIPDQQQIVYIPVDAAAEKGQTSQPAMVATNGIPDADNTLPASSTMDEAEISRPDVRWLNPISHLRSRDLAMGNPWETVPMTSQTAQQATIPSLRSGDWPAMVGDNGLSPVPRQSDSLLPMDWTHLLHTRGS